MPSISAQSTRSTQLCRVISRTTPPSPPPTWRGPPRAAALAGQLHAGTTTHVHAAAHHKHAAERPLQRAQRQVRHHLLQPCRRIASARRAVGLLFAPASVEPDTRTRRAPSAGCSHPGRAHARTSQIETPAWRGGRGKGPHAGALPRAKQSTASALLAQATTTWSRACSRAAAAPSRLESPTWRGAAPLSPGDAWPRRVSSRCKRGRPTAQLRAPDLQ